MDREKPDAILSFENSQEIKVLKLINSSRGKIPWQNQKSFLAKNRLPVKFLKLALLLQETFRERNISSLSTAVSEYIQLNFPFWVRTPALFSQSKDKERIAVAVGYHWNFLTSVLPIIKELKNAGKEVCVFAEGRAVRAELKKSLIRFCGISEFYQDFSNEIPGIRKKLSEWIMDMDRISDSDVFNKFYDINIWQALKQMDGFTTILNKRFLSFCIVIESLHRFFQKVAPKLLIAPTDTTFLERSAVILARDKNIPSLHIQHGLIGRSSFRDSVATKICVWGDIFKKSLIDFGRQPNSIEIVGWTKKFNDNSLDKEKIKRKLKLPHDKPILTWITSPLDKTLFNISYEILTKEIMSEIVKSLESNRNLHLLIKLHHFDTHRFYIKLIRTFQPAVRARIKIVKHQDVQEILCISDAVIIIQSTAIVEAMKADAAIIKVRWFRIEGDELFHYAQPFITINDADELSPVVNRIFSQQTFKQGLQNITKSYLPNFLYKSDNEAVNLVVNLAEKLLHANQKYF